MTLKTLSALAIVSIFILSAVAVEARHGDDYGRDHRDDHGRGGPGYPRPRPPHPPRPPNYPPSYPPNYGQVAVQLPINQRMYNGMSINLSRFIDVNYYRGMRVIAVEVSARSVFNNAILDLFVNGYANTSIYVSPFNQLYSLFPGSVIVGYGADLVLANRGDVDVYSVTLRLSR